MNKNIILAHGSGCRAGRDLVQGLIFKYLGNHELKKLRDAASIDIKSQKLAYTTDSYTVNPLFFNGSDIGKLAVFGTVNDLAVSGAEPLYISLSFIIEEGFPLFDFERVLSSIKKAKIASGVEIVTGDTKVVERGKADKLFITTSGIGIRKYRDLEIGNIKAGDKVIINGNIGDHEIAVLLARGEFKFKATVESDCCSLWGVINRLISKCRRIKFMRDVTRGGVGVLLNEIVEGSNFGIEISENKIPVNKKVKAISDMLGFDPLYLANEGKFVLVIDKKEELEALVALKSSGFRDAVTIGTVSDIYKGKAVLKTISGGRRIIDYPYGTQLPRIC